MNDLSPLVAIRCTTYNHELYIRECLEGFIMQKTTFPFIAIVHDDASTDGTAAIIKEYSEKYPDLIKPIYETENQYSKKDGSLDKIVDNAIAQTECKYVAICEGDDYWTDPLKLQKHLEILEKDKSIGLVYSKAKKIIQSKNKFKGEIGGDYLDFEHLLKQNCIPTLTVTIRASLYKNYIDEIKPYSMGWKMGDYPIWLWFAQNSKLCFFNEVQGIYRVLENSASHSTNWLKTLQFAISSAKIAYYFACKYHICEFEILTQLLWVEYQYAALINNKDDISRIDKEVKEFFPRSRNLRLRLMTMFARSPKILTTLLSLFRKIKYSFH